MSSNNASGVRNLRAMFENKASSDQSTSPPSRGRSPLDTENPENTRPLSKVRASFVAVERPGQPGQASQWGLRKTSDVSSVSGANGNTTEESPLRSITSPQSAMADQTAREDLGLILKGSPFEGAKAHSKQPKDQVVPSVQTKKTVPEINTKPTASGQEKVASAGSKMKSPTTTKAKSASESSKPAAVKGAVTKQAAPKSEAKSPISPQSPQSAKVNTSQPAASIKGIRGGPGKIMAVMDSANKARVEREKKTPIEAKPSQSEKKDAPKAPATNNIKKNPTSPKVEKPKPVTQAKPPVAATATTASAGRTDGPPKSLNTDNRRVSAVRKEKPPPKVANTLTAASLAKKTPRNSLAPQTNGHERPKSRVSTAKEESFLARMMRPTASSQQKVHEKVAKADSPPRARKVSDKIRQSLGPGKNDNKENENEEGSPLETTKSIPEVEEQKTESELPAETVVAQEAT